MYISALLALLVFSGCSEKQPAIDATQNSGAGTTDTMNQRATTEQTAVIDPVTTVNPNDKNAAANTGTNGSDGGMSSIYFDFDKYDIREDMQGTMKNDSQLVKNKTVKLEGNCDEFGSDEYNFALGLKRAQTVKKALVDSGIEEGSISMTSLGKGNPLCAEKTEECWAKNRRVDFKLP
jgi:peptidoglycan-associated lipoprotein